MISSSSLASAIGAVSVGSNVLAAIKIGAVAVGILAVFGFTYAGCQSLMNAGYQKAEADRLADLAVDNAETTEKLRRDHAASRTAEQTYREQRDHALAAARAAIDARGARPPLEATKGTPCVPGCTRLR